MENITMDKLALNIIFLIKGYKEKPNKFFTLKELIRSEINKANRQGLNY